MSTTASFAGASTYSTIAFAPITTNPSVAANGVSASNVPISTTSATINGNMVASFPGYSVLMRTGYTDTNGNILGLLIVRASCRRQRVRAARSHTHVCPHVEMRAAHRMRTATRCTT